MTSQSGPGADGSERLLNLACGTGQISFALKDRFVEIWAVGQVIAPASKQPWTRYGSVGTRGERRADRAVPPLPDKPGPTDVRGHRDQPGRNASQRSRHASGHSLK